MNYFLQVLGEQTIGWAVVVIAAGVFLVKCYKVVDKYFTDKALREDEKERQLKDVMDQVAQYPKWHKQSLDIQKQFTEAISKLEKGQAEQQKTLDRIESDNARREQSKMRDRLLQSYRYYTSLEHNPKQAWTDMEAEVFWSMFAEYELAGGNGGIHTEVQPAMRRLEKIPMHETERVAQLMSSRR